MIISLYRGGLHRIVGVPRRWSLPRPSMGLATFKSSLEKREAALRRQNTDQAQNTLSLLDLGCLLDDHNQVTQTLDEQDVIMDDIGGSEDRLEAKISEITNKKDPEICSNKKEHRKRKREDHGVEAMEECSGHNGEGKTHFYEAEPMHVDRMLEGQNAEATHCAVSGELMQDTVPSSVSKDEDDDEDEDARLGCDFKKAKIISNADGDNDDQNEMIVGPSKASETGVNPHFGSENEAKDAPFLHSIPQMLEGNQNVQAGLEEEETLTKKSEVETKLKILTAEKHRLVQLLKQILSNEEESKRKGQAVLQSPTSIVPQKSPVTDAFVTAVLTENSAKGPDLEEGELILSSVP